MALVGSVFVLPLTALGPDLVPDVVFMKALADDLHQHGYIVSQDVPVDDDNYDMKSLGQINDYLVPMVYDEHYESGEPGPVASETFFEGQLDRIQKIVPPSKLVIGFGNYGYDWPIGGQGGSEVTFDDVMAAGRVRIPASSGITPEKRRYCAIPSGQAA